MKKIMVMAGALPFFIAVFLNAFVDLGHKIIIQNTVFKVYDGQEQVVLTAIVNGLILLPFILLFSPAGFASDRFPKTRVMRLSAWAAVLLTAGITVSYALGWFWVSFAMTFLLAVQSAFYSPAKFAYIKVFFGRERLAEINGVVQAVSIVAILCGTLLFSVLFEAWFPGGTGDKAKVLQAILPVGFMLVACSVVELLMVYRLPNPELSAESSDQAVQFDVKRYLSGGLLKANLHPVWQKEAIRLSIIGLATFWSIGQVMLAAFPAFAKAQTGETNTVIIQAIIAASGVGIALGAALAGRFSRNYIETGFIPLGAVGLALGLFVLPGLQSLVWMAVCFLVIGVMGGLFIVPLNAMVQYHADDKALGNTLSANNFIQNIAMLSFLCVTVGFSMMGIGGQALLMSMGVLALIGGCYTVYKLPQSLVRILLSLLMSNHYKIAVQGMKNVPQSGGVLLLGNHISWIDWAILQLACPRPVRFVMHKRIYELWYLRWFFKLFGCIPIESGISSGESLQQIARMLNDGQVACLFPEGMISRTGHFAEFRSGYERAAAAADDTVKIVPFYLRGLWGSHFSLASDHLKKTPVKGFRRELVVAFGPAIDKQTRADVVKRRVFDLSISSWRHYAETLPPIPNAWIDTVKRQRGAIAIADTMGAPLSATRALTAAIAFSRRIKKISHENTVGLLMPTSAGGVLANMAGLLAGKIIVNLNYTASAEAFASALQQAEIKTVYTSKRFLKKLQGRGIDFSAQLENIEVVYLETLKEGISKLELIATMSAVKCLPALVLKKVFASSTPPDNTAVILFSSGSEGLPKGIRLSHTNVMANLKQIAEVLNAKNEDVVMASLPLFHAFGLTVTQFMPLIEGMPLVCHADPTDALGIAKAIARYRVSVLCATSTFLRLYCRNKKVHPLMLDSLRVVVSGAEKLNPDVREAFKLKFNKTVYEGFGASETTPVASVNVPDSLDVDSWRVQRGDKVGTVGMPLPGTSFKIVDPETFDELPSGDSGMILIGGVQVMQGYLHDKGKCSEAIKIIDGVRWYVTGDKGYIDRDGFLSIVDRYSRFAKLGGEMISLSAVERAVGDALQSHIEACDIDVVAVNLPDEKKGEQIILLTASAFDLDTLRKAMLANECSALLIPAVVIKVDALPKLGSGKADFSAAKQLAVEHSTKRGVA